MICLFMPDHSLPGQFSRTGKKIFVLFQKTVPQPPWFSPIGERVYSALPPTASLGFSTLERPFSYAFSYYSHRFPEVLIDSMRNPENITTKERSSLCVSTIEVPRIPIPFPLQLNKTIQEKNLIVWFYTRFFLRGRRYGLLILLRRRGVRKRYKWLNSKENPFSSRLTTATVCARKGLQWICQSHGSRRVPKPESNCLTCAGNQEQGT